MSVKFFDNGKTYDRYTMVFDSKDADGLHDCISMSDRPMHPQGVCLHGTCYLDAVGVEVNLADLPQGVQEFVDYYMNSETAL